jgi:hypothetical protein
MINFINNLIKYSSIIFNDFLKFIIENKLLSLFMVSFFALAISQLLSSLKLNIFDYYLNKIFKTTNNNLINLLTSFFQFILIILFLYFIYNNFIRPIEYKYTINKFDDISWKNNLLNEIRNINNKIK